MYVSVCIVECTDGHAHRRFSFSPDPQTNKQTQELFGVEGMRQEAQALLGQSLLGWLSRGHEGFKAPHWSFLINTLSCTCVHSIP